MSVRRRAFLAHAHPDLQFENLRGNVETRIEKVRSGQVDVTLLALAGLKRLGLADEADAILEPEVMLPAAGQGAVGIQIREGDAARAALLEPINCARTVLRVMAERGVLEALDGSCHTPVGAYAEILGDGLMRLRGWHAAMDGAEILKEDWTQAVQSADEARAFGRRIGEAIKDLS